MASTGSELTLRSALWLPRAGAPVVVIAGAAVDCGDIPLEVLWEAGLGTLRLDPPSPLAGDDAGPGHQAARFARATAWLRANAATSAARIGYAACGRAGTAALLAAADHPHEVTSVVALSSPLDTVAARLPDVEAATLLVLGGRDEARRQEARALAPRLAGCHRVEVVAGAGPRFTEAGALELAAHLAGAWSALWLRPSDRRHHAA